MGTYTVFYGTVKLKHDALKECFTDGILDMSKVLKLKRLRKHPDIIAFSKLKRFSLMGYCAGHCATTHVHYDFLRTIDIDFKDSINYETINILKGNEYTFFGALKNYCGSLTKFIEILPLIADNWEMYTNCDGEGVKSEFGKVLYNPLRVLRKKGCMTQDQENHAFYIKD